MKRIEELQKLGQSILDLLEQLDDTNFNDHISKINSKITEYHTIKGTSEVSQETVIADMTKLINRSFDNIIRVKELECQNILVEIDRINTQNKINNYRKVPWTLNP